jgi:hypothetical protein
MQITLIKIMKIDTLNALIFRSAEVINSLVIRNNLDFIYNFALKFKIIFKSIVNLHVQPNLKLLFLVYLLLHHSSY